MKKTISLILVVVLVMAMAIPAFAAMPETIEPKACIHSTLNLVSKEFDEYRYYNTDYCMSCYDKVYECSNKNCDYTYKTIEWIYGTETDHVHVICDATCDGTNQTWYYHCRYCSGDKYIDPDPHPCPRPHSSGNCTSLPI